MLLADGYRMDVKPEEDDATPGKQVTRGIPHADKLTTLAVTPYLSGNSETIFRSAGGMGMSTDATAYAAARERCG
ncbi:hypothetical protein SANTM175S_08423 [Streptomyces antimycoticus]